MKAKYIFTKYGNRRNNLCLDYIVPENDTDYDVADVFITDLYSSDGETMCFEAEDLEEAVYFANKYFHTCASPKNIEITYECWDKLAELSLILDDPSIMTKVHSFLTDQNTPYVPAPVKIDTNWGRFKNKRYRRFYQRHENMNGLGAYSPVYNYSTVYDRM